MNNNKLKNIFIIITTFVVYGCATVNSTMEGMSSVERKAAVCAGAIGIGAVIGGFIGGGKGALIGLAPGAVACALFVMLDPYDKKQIHNAQVEALNENKPINTTWQGKDGATRKVEVSQPETIKVATHSNQICRKINTDITVKNNNDMITDIYCRTPEGDWEPITT